MPELTRERRAYSDDEKRNAIKRLKAKPPDQTVAALCDELGISLPTIYYWKSRAEQGQPFNKRDDPKAGAGTPGRKKKPPGTAIAVHGKDSRQLEIAATRRPTDITVEAAPLTQSERDELAVLRAEVKRYKRMIFASMADGP